MDEGELREIARQVREQLDVILDFQTNEIERMSAEIDAALALPDGIAKRALRRALAAHPLVHAWVLAQILIVDPADRLARATERAVVREDGAVAAGERASAPEPDVRHYLSARLADRVETGRPLSVVVAVTRMAWEKSAPIKDLRVPPEGLTLTILISADGLMIRGEREAEIHVPADRDSEPHRFALTAGAVGLYTVTVEAFRGGTYLGAVSLQVSVERSVVAVEERQRVATLSSVAAEPGEVTLQVRRDRDGYRFQLIADTWYDEVTSLMGDATAQVSQLATELRTMAAKESPYRSGRDVRDRVRQLGIGLWSAAVPEAVQSQFWREADRIKTFTVVADNDTIPWELLYPLNDTDDNGFLAEQFPVVRRIYGAPRVTSLPLDSVTYVVPPRSPANALDEVAGVRERLGGRITDGKVLTELAAVKQLVLASTSLVHFACHNSFSDAAGSSIALDGGPWKPSDLAEATTRRTLANSNPLVFLNACRSAGEADWFSQMSGWATGFVRAGAGAFIGTLWAVRSSSARTFAEAFYRELVTGGRSLGDASLRARREIANDESDPTWLAYTVYGNPAMQAARTQEDAP